MTTQKPHFAAPAPPENVGGSSPRATAYAGVGAVDVGGDLPSFWTALCRYRERHGLIDPQQRQPLLSDDDLHDLRSNDDARAFSFDDDDLAIPTRR